MGGPIEEEQAVLLRPVRIQSDRQQFSAGCCMRRPPPVGTRSSDSFRASTRPNEPVEAVSGHGRLRRLPSASATAAIRWLDRATRAWANQAASASRRNRSSSARSVHRPPSPTTKPASAHSISTSPTRTACAAASFSTARASSTRPPACRSSTRPFPPTTTWSRSRSSTPSRRRSPMNSASDYNRYSNDYSAGELQVAGPGSVPQRQRLRTERATRSRRQRAAVRNSEPVSVDRQRDLDQGQSHPQIRFRRLEADFAAELHAALARRLRMELPLRLPVRLQSGLHRAALAGERDVLRRPHLHRAVSSTTAGRSRRTSRSISACATNIRACRTARPCRPSMPFRTCPGLINSRSRRRMKNALMPRIGIAYSPGTSGKTSIRAGFGRNFDVLLDNFGLLTLPPQDTTTVDVTGGRQGGFLADGGIPPNTSAAAPEPGRCPRRHGRVRSQPDAAGVPSMEHRHSARVPQRLHVREPLHGHARHPPAGAGSVKPPTGGQCVQCSAVSTSRRPARPL